MNVMMFFSFRITNSTSQVVNTDDVIADSAALRITVVHLHPEFSAFRALDILYEFHV